MGTCEEIEDENEGSDNDDDDDDDDDDEKEEDKTSGPALVSRVEVDGELFQAKPLSRPTIAATAAVMAAVAASWLGVCASKGLGASAIDELEDDADAVADGCWLAFCSATAAAAAGNEDLAGGLR